jgi:hypothetical protein
MDVQVQGGRRPLVLSADAITLELIAGMLIGKGDAPGAYVVSVMAGVRIVIHWTNVARVDSNSQRSECRQRAEPGQHR